MLYCERACSLNMEFNQIEGIEHLCIIWMWYISSELWVCIARMRESWNFVWGPWRISNVWERGKCIAALPWEPLPNIGQQGGRDLTNADRWLHVGQRQVSGETLRCRQSDNRWNNRRPSFLSVEVGADTWLLFSTMNRRGHKTLHPNILHLPIVPMILTSKVPFWIGLGLSEFPSLPYQVIVFFVRAEGSGMGSKGMANVVVWGL